MRTPNASDFLERARLAEMRAARATNAALREALLKVAAAWRNLIPPSYAGAGIGPRPASDMVRGERR